MDYGCVTYWKKSQYEIKELLIMKRLKNLLLFCYR